MNADLSRFRTLAPILLLGLFTSTLSAANQPDNQWTSAPDFRHLLIDTQWQKDPTAINPTPNAAADLIIGDTPNEVLVVSGYLNIQGDLNIIADGRVEITPTGTLHINGDINIVGSASLIGNSGRIEFEQTYSYESQLLVWEQSTLDLNGTTVDGSGHSISMAVASDVIWNNVQVTNGFATWALFENANVNLTDTINAGEFLQLDPSTLSLLRCQTVLFWLTLPNGSTVDTTLPQPGDVALFEINPSTPWATGIPYTVRIEDCTDSMWAIMARDGSNATIRNSDLRVVGSIFENADTIEIIGLANGMPMTDSAFQWGGIQHRFINSTVQTWNLYAWQQTNLTIRSSVFGELFSEDQALVTVEQSICDGTGGHMRTSGQAQLFFLTSLCLSQITIEEDSLFVAASSSFISPIIDATGNSISAFYNAPLHSDPRAHDAAAIFIAAINPLTATRGETAPITGSARVIKGPSSALDFVSYNVEFLDDPNWTLIEGPVTTPVNQDPLAQWDTAPLAPGTYLTRLSMIHSGGGDPIELGSTATINPPACPADLNADGNLNFLDVSAFLAAYGAQNPIADFNNDTLFNFLDVSAFLAAFGQGCP